MTLVTQLERETDYFTLSARNESIGSSESVAASIELNSAALLAFEGGFEAISIYFYFKLFRINSIAKII